MIRSDNRVSPVIGDMAPRPDEQSGELFGLAKATENS